MTSTTFGKDSTADLVVPPDLPAVLPGTTGEPRCDKIIPSPDNAIKIASIDDAPHYEDPVVQEDSSPEDATNSDPSQASEDDATSPSATGGPPDEEAPVTTGSPVNNEVVPPKVKVSFSALKRSDSTETLVAPNGTTLSSLRRNDSIITLVGSEEVTGKLEEETDDISSGNQSPVLLPQDLGTVDRPATSAIAAGELPALPNTASDAALVSETSNSSRVPLDASYGFVFPPPSPLRESSLDLAVVPHQSSNARPSDPASKSNVLVLPPNTKPLRTLASVNVSSQMSHVLPPNENNQVSFNNGFGGYPTVAGTIPYGSFGMIGSANGAPGGPIPLAVPPYAASVVPQGFPAGFAQLANRNYPRGFPPFMSGSVNGNWSMLAAQNMYGQPFVMPFPGGIYPPVQHLANPIQSHLQQGQYLNATTLDGAVDLYDPGEQFIVDNPDSHSARPSQRGRKKRRRLSGHVTLQAAQTSSASTSSDPIPIPSTSDPSSSTTDSSSTPAAKTADSLHPTTFNIDDSSPGCICRLKGCNKPLECDDKSTFNVHIKDEHGFRGYSKHRRVSCEWVVSADGATCGKDMEFQSFVKHVCEVHFNSLGTTCPLCGGKQARADNMYRHFFTCSVFVMKNRDEQMDCWARFVPYRQFEEFLQRGDGRKRKTRKK